MSTQGQGDVVANAETTTVHDPFLGVDVQVSSRLTDRLRGKYACGPTLPNGEPEFGWRQHETPPIQHEAAKRIDEQDAEIDRLRALLFSSRGEQGWRTMDSAPKDGTHIIGNTQWGAREIWWHKDAYEGEYWTDEGDSEPAPTGWIPKPGSVPTSLAGQGTDGYVLVPRSVIASNDPDTPECIWPISWLRTMVACADEASDKGDDPMAHDEMVREVRRLLDGLTAALQSSPQPTAGGDAPTVPNTESFAAISRHLGDKVPCFHEPAGCCVDDVTNEKFCVEGCLLLRVYKAGYSDALSAERARVIEECAKVAETFHEDDDGIDRQVKRHVAAALRALGQQDTGGADHG